jgi:hypothetical protein
MGKATQAELSAIRRAGTLPARSCRAGWNASRFHWWEALPHIVNPSSAGFSVDSMRRMAQAFHRVTATADALLIRSPRESDPDARDYNLTESGRAATITDRNPVFDEHPMPTRLRVPSHVCRRPSRSGCFLVAASARPDFTAAEPDHRFSCRERHRDPLYAGGRVVGQCRVLTGTGRPVPVRRSVFYDWQSGHSRVGAVTDSDGESVSIPERDSFLTSGGEKERHRPGFDSPGSAATDHESRASLIYTDRSVYRPLRSLLESPGYGGAA